ncbi:MAG: hypothetical protein U0K71_06100 [Paludibacteraceae bacterium]|nr:hypothetical protein [Paludibacteraceae bacterium]
MKIELKTDTSAKEYSVEKRIELMDAQHEETQVVVYTEDLTVIVDNSQPQEIIAKVERSDVKKDGKAFPQNPIDHYFIKSGEALNKLDLQLSADGGIMKVVNRDEILKNWEYTKIYLDSYFVSDDGDVESTIKGWTKQIDSVIKDEVKYMHSVENDLLYNRFFSGYWLDYGEDNQLVRNQIFPAIFGNARTVLTEVLTVSETEGKRKIDIAGSLNREASDMTAIAESLGMDETQIDGLSIELKGVCQTDDSGLIEKIDLKAIAELADSDFKRIYCLIVNRK